jgi:hypothetical protein
MLLPQNLRTNKLVGVKGIYHRINVQANFASHNAARENYDSI